MSEQITDILTEDVITVPSQRYALISVVSPSSTQKFETCALKIRGVFYSREEANAWATKLSKVDSTFDIFLVDMNRWLPIPAPLDNIEDHVFQDKVLNDIISSHQEEQMKSKEFFEKEKQESMRNPPPYTILEEDEKKVL
jgi:hypothetical protein